MKSISILACFLFCLIGYTQTVEIPDRNFEKALVDLKIDSDAKINGLILKSDAQKVTFLDVSGRKIKSLKGIEAFTSLQYLDCKNNQLSNLNVNDNIGLTYLYADVNNTIGHHKEKLFFSWFD